MRIIITGTPGTGKTTLAKRLSRSLSLPYFSIIELIKVSSINKEFNNTLNTLEVDEQELKEFLDLYFKNRENFILEGHLSHLISSTLVDFCIVLRTENSKLYDRLKRRGYPESKIRENIEAEIFNECYEEAKENNHKILTIDTTNFNDDDYALLLDLLKSFKK